MCSNNWRSYFASPVRGRGNAHEMGAFWPSQNAPAVRPIGTNWLQKSRTGTESPAQSPALFAACSRTRKGGNQPRKPGRRIAVLDHGRSIKYSSVAWAHSWVPDTLGAASMADEESKQRILQWQDRMHETFDYNGVLGG